MIEFLSFPSRILDALSTHPFYFFFFVLGSTTLSLLILSLSNYKHNQTSKILKSSIGEAKKEVDWVELSDKIFNKRHDKIELMLEQANILMTVNEYKRIMLFSALGGVGVGFLLFPFPPIWKSIFVFLGSTYLQEIFGRILAAFTLGYLGSFIPLLLVKRKVKQRATAFSKQIQDALDLIADGLQSGLILKYAIKQSGEELEYPIGPEFQRVYNEMETGLTFEEAITGMEQRIGIPNFSLAVSAMKIQTEAGGELEPLLRNMSSIIQEREELRRDIEKTIAGSKMTGLILLVAPIAFLIIFTLINKDTYITMIQSTSGQIMIAVGAICYAIAVFFITRIIKNASADL